MDIKTAPPTEELKDEGSSKNTLKWLLSYCAQEASWKIKDKPTQGLNYIVGFSEAQYSQQRLVIIIDLNQGDIDYQQLFQNVMTNMTEENTKVQALFIVSSGGRLDTNQEMIIIRGQMLDGLRGMMTFDVERKDDRILPAQKLNSTLSFSPNIEVGVIEAFFELYKSYANDTKTNVQSVPSDVR